MERRAAPFRSTNAAAASPPARRNIGLAAAVDRALGDPREANLHTALRHAQRIDATAAAEVIRRRAQRRLRHERARRHELIAARDGMIQSLYAGRAPHGWGVAFCDGSVAPGTGRAAIGAILIDPGGGVPRALARRTRAANAFEAEIAAVTAVLKAAHRRGVRRLRVYTDCLALARLWQQQRTDVRLARMHALARQFERLALHPIPRAHNQPANRLARTAARPRVSSARPPQS